MPVAQIVQAVRARAKELGARKVEVCVDCVAYAPHRRVDVREWDVDYAYFSFYKVRPSLPPLLPVTCVQIGRAHV